ncbi:hypothetical protein [Novipirellula artificiosorum]|uniref:hypothetical protein n=1 Tax=Novipirellula artificiosorum TaxID=2528016 RepID=UPI0011B42D41|nr:hypothetical protein [Novipirellula artificiosorum]
MNLRPLRPEGTSEQTQTPENAEQNDAPANRYHDGYTRKQTLSELIEDLREQLTDGEIEILAHALAASLGSDALGRLADALSEQA